MAESERFRLSVDGDDCFSVQGVAKLDLAVVLLLVEDLWQVLLAPVTISDVTDDHDCDEDKYTTSCKNKEEHAPVWWCEYRSHGCTDFE